MLRQQAWTAPTEGVPRLPLFFPITVTFGTDGRSPRKAKEVAMRWWMVLALPFCIGAGEVPGSPLPVEIGVLSCTVGEEIDTPAADQTAAASVTREMLCSFKPTKNGAEETYSGDLKSINAAGPIPQMVTLLWTVRAPIGTQTVAGLLQQRYAADPATPAGKVALLIGERTTEITLHTMSDKKEGSVSMERRVAPPFAIVAIELKLKATAT
jgi:hypothetical protein